MVSMTGVNFNLIPIMIFTVFIKDFFRYYVRRSLIID